MFRSTTTAATGIPSSPASARDKHTMRNQRLKTYPAPDYKPIYGRANGWGFNPDEQQKATFTGMGFDINIHDQFACESQGRIQDRTREHLGSTDQGIVLYRRMLLDSIKKNEAGEKPPMVLDPAAACEITGPPAVDGIGPTDRLEDYWKEFDANRRRKSNWAA